ncbi:MAG TPA: Fe-S cluster assembly scaffold protein NifU [Bacillota bacterium]|jgi:nitrogen fixation NifU-like protein|nr:Fe-S cluster assembly scaffold protein NifU [Bacillota bacterium]HOA35038.1 Fe-S cluster assembly scaffold protein NifU [Bacillota bacterium]HOJ84909.1 Fe-S cluster assembly scaffold protein NifU [Bacillota bacterium]HOL15985.1 Fe-S cluster assembly scaffold protein NifU [Bacillota bacterium]HPZ10943.1 Fe-S cluster assembly scaffold protein NifU [Bacillota bacterium]
MYNEKVIDHFTNPRNVGEMPDADVVGESGSFKCGDTMKIYLKIEGDRIADIKFQTFGCGAAIASSSMLTEMAKGKTLEEARRITNKDVAAELGGLPPLKMHCSNLAADALQDAINRYLDGEKGAQS